MKKLLATLIVATMLISCMSVITFAAEASQISIGSSLTFEKGVTKKGKVWLLNDEFTAAYEAFAADNYADYDAAYAASPLFAALEDLTGNDDTAYNALTFPYEFSGDEFIPVPFYADGDGVNTIGAYLTYDSDVLEPVLVGSTFSAINIVGGKLKVAYAEAEPSVGYVATAYFKIKAGATGDASGKATTTITMSLGEDGWAATAVELVPATIGNTSISIPLKGLVAGGSSKPEKVTADGDVTVADSVALANTTAYTASAVDDKGWLDTHAAQVVSGDDKDVSLYDGTYNVFFGSNDFNGVTTAPDKVGLALYENGVRKGFFEAKNIVEGKWGILFFGLDSAKTYTTKRFVQYDGEDPIEAND